MNDHPFFLEKALMKIAISAVNALVELNFSQWAEQARFASESPHKAIALPPEADGALEHFCAVYAGEMHVQVLEA